MPGVPDAVAVPKTSLPEVEPLPRREPSQKILAIAEKERKRSEQMRLDFEASMSRLAEQDAMRASKSALDHERRAQQEQERVAQRERLQKQDEDFWAELHMQDEEARVRREKTRQEQARLIWEDDARERKNIKIKQKTAFYEFKETAHISAREHLEQALKEISSAIRAEEDELMNYGTKQTRHVEQGRDPQLKVKAIADEAEEILMLEEEGGAEEWAPALVPLQEQLQELARVRLLQKEGGDLMMGRSQPDLYPAPSQFKGTSGDERPFHPTPREVLDQLQSEEHARLRELDLMLSSQSSLYPRESSLAAGQTAGDNRPLVAQPEQDPREGEEEGRNEQEEEAEEEKEPEARDAAEQGLQRFDSNVQDAVEKEGGGAEGKGEGAAFQGDIDFETFACMSINQGIPREELRAIFDGLDVDKNGVLDVVEFSRYTVRKATYELRAGMRVKVVGLEAGRREAEYNGKTGSIVRQGQCSKWIVAVDVVKQSDSSKTRKKRRSTDKDGVGKDEDKAKDRAGKEKTRTKDKAKAVPRKQTVLLKLHSNYITPVDAKPVVPEGRTAPLTSWPALARPSPPPPAEAAAPRVGLSPEKARQADELVSEKLERMRARAALAQGGVDAVAAVTARAASEEPAAQLPDDEGLQLSKAGEDEWCCAQVEAYLVRLALARDRLHGLKVYPDIETRTCNLAPVMHSLTACLLTNSSWMLLAMASLKALKVSMFVAAGMRCRHRLRFAIGLGLGVKAWLAHDCLSSRRSCPHFLARGTSPSGCVRKGLPRSVAA